MTESIRFSQTYAANRQIYVQSFTYDPAASRPEGATNLVESGARSAEPPDAAVVAEIEAVLSFLEERGMFLTQKGIFTQQPAEYGAWRQAGRLLDVRTIQLALTDIELVFCHRVPAHLDEKRVYASASSYGLKHHLEHYRTDRQTDKYRSGYISNGDFIMAMFLSGFQMKYAPHLGRNCKFKCCSLMEEVKFVPGYSKREFSGTYVCAPKNDLLDY